MNSKHTPCAVGNAPSESEPIPKRRKIRKGTFSCWECKHRKKRCEEVPGSTSCILCQRHGLPCSSQEFADTSVNDCRDAEQRLDRVEAIIDRLVQQRSGQVVRRKLSAAARSLQHFETPTLESVNHERISRGPSLTSFLYSLLPNPAIAVVILRNSKFFRSPLQISQKPHSNTNPEEISDDLVIPQSAHPILLARKLIQLALCLRNSDTKASEQLKVQLNESVTSAASRYFDTACGYVLSHDELISSLDGLQTLMLQSRYYITIGDLRKAWSTHRRVSRIASAMGMPLLAQTMGGHANSIWFQLVYSDRFLSLMLGMPFAITERYLESAECRDASTPAQRLERVQVIAAGQIIARNMRMQNCDMSYEMAWSSDKEIAETRGIDQELKKATRLLPSSWWLAPPLDNATIESEVQERTGRLLVQMHQHYLLVLLHQPYLIKRLCSYIGDNGLRISDGENYSVLAAVSASREMISHYLAFRGYHRSTSPRATDDKCFLASITLLLAHFEGHRLRGMNVLEHQRCHDLGIIGRVIDFMKEISVLNDNPLAAARSQTLSKFVEIEAHVAEGLPYHIWIERKTNENGTTEVEDTMHDFQISVPYCGNLHISLKIRNDPPIEDVWNSELFDLVVGSPDLINNQSTLATADGNFFAVEDCSSIQT